MWVATFSVTAIQVGLTKGRRHPDSLLDHTRTEADPAPRVLSLPVPLPLGGSARTR
jgi:hypothetical protein